MVNDLAELLAKYFNPRGENAAVLKQPVADVVSMFLAVLEAECMAAAGRLKDVGTLTESERAMHTSRYYTNAAGYLKHARSRTKTPLRVDAMLAAFARSVATKEVTSDVPPVAGPSVGQSGRKRSGTRRKQPGDQPPNP